MVNTHAWGGFTVDAANIGIHDCTKCKLVEANHEIEHQMLKWRCPTLTEESAQKQKNTCKCISEEYWN